MDAQERAERAGKVMFARDASSPHVGMTLDKISPGKAEMSLSVLDYMLNGAKVCHGGYIFMLADSCFAFACNSHNDATLAQGCSIDFIRPAVLGDQLTAKAIELSRGRKTGVYDVMVTNQNDKLVATFRGKSFSSGEPVFEEQAE